MKNTIFPGIYVSHPLEHLYIFLQCFKLLLSTFQSYVHLFFLVFAHCFTNCAVDKSQCSAVTWCWYPHIFNASFLSPWTSLMVVSCLVLLQVRFCVTPHVHPQQVEHGRTSATICCTCSGWSTAIVLSCGGVVDWKLAHTQTLVHHTQSQSRPH